MISIRLATEFDLDFLADCIGKSYEINDFSITFRDYLYYIASKTGYITRDNKKTFDLLKLYLNSKNPNQNIYIVNRANMDVGFFTQDEDEVNSTIGGTCWIHPRACKMSIIGIVQACIIRGALVSSDWKYAEFNSWNPLLVGIYKNFMPGCLVTKLREEYYTIYYDFSTMPEGHVENIKQTYKVRDIDSENNTFIFSRK